MLLESRQRILLPEYSFAVGHLWNHNSVPFSPGGILLPLQCQDRKAGVSRLARSSQMRKYHKCALSRCPSVFTGWDVLPTTSVKYPEMAFWDLLITKLQSFQMSKMIIWFLFPWAVRIALCLLLHKSILPDTWAVSMEQTELQMHCKFRISLVNS